MTIVYGNSIEPGGIKLDSYRAETECPSCKKQNAIMRFWEMCEGGTINPYSSLHCNDCGYSEGDSNEDDESLPLYNPYPFTEFDIYSIDEIFEIANQAIHSFVDNACTLAVRDIEHKSYQTKQNFLHIYA